MTCINANRYFSVDPARNAFRRNAGFSKGGNKPKAEPRMGNLMPPKNPIDERDIDELLASLTDRQIADLFDMSEEAVAKIRRQRRMVGSGNSGDET